MGLGNLRDHFSRYVYLSHQDQQERHVMGPIYERVSSGGTQEESLFCHGAHPVEHHPLGP